MEFGDRVKMLRENLGMTQEELAKKSGYSGKWSINKIESGISDVSREKIIALAKALQTSPSFLMGWVDEASESKPTETTQKWASKRHKILYDRIRNATDEQLEKMEKIWELIEEEEEKYDL